MGSLHERNLSYWVASTEDTSYPTLDGDEVADVCVVGGGITGLTTAYLLARDGARVVLVEAGRIASGVTGYTTAKLTSQHHLVYARLVRRHGEERARAYAAAQQDAIELVAGIVRDESIDCDFGRAPAYVYTEREDKVAEIEQEAEAARALGLPAGVRDASELPWPVRAALRFENQALFHPRRYCLGLARALLARGGAIAERTRASGVQDGDPCVVTTDRGVVRAGAVVLATHLPFPGEGLFFARNEASRSYAIAARFEDLPEGMYISAEQPTRSIRPHPGADGNVLIVGGGGHGHGQESETERYYDELEEWARERFGIEKPEWRWSAHDFTPADGVPFVGRITPRRRNTFVATGFAKWGMTNGTAAARLIADLIAGRDNAAAPVYDSTRINPLKSARTVTSVSARTTKAIVVDRLAALVGRSLSDLPPGKGTVIESGGEQIAAFRDDDGSIRAVTASCTHMGCIVRFNEAERTWDCPCHGSRFDASGRVLSGPATEDLEPRELG